MRPRRIPNRVPCPAAALVLALVASACSSNGDSSPEPGKPNDLTPQPVLEYLQVELDEGPDAAPATPCTVLVNGRPLGKTSKLIEFEGGRCVITLDPSGDYEPAEQVVTVDGTSPLTPLEIVFRRRR